LRDGPTEVAEDAENRRPEATSARGGGFYGEFRPMALVTAARVDRQNAGLVFQCGFHVLCGELRALAEPANGGFIVRDGQQSTGQPRGKISVNTGTLLGRVAERLWFGFVFVGDFEGFGLPSSGPCDFQG
jgi:hypothetical protein